jgi:hypothetical protein
MDKEAIRTEVKNWSIWWIEQRRQKLEKQLSESMTVNPFLMPFIFDYHGLDNFEELVDIIVASHLITGHNTGFGKLIDEKILPNVFGTTKLDASFRANNPPFDNSSFDEIDHYVQRPDGTLELLSLKAGKWTIQLSMARQLNTAFSEILRFYKHLTSHIVVGVFYGSEDDLTDKYDLIRGINRGANHHLADLRENVSVYTGKTFWDWLGNAENVQESVLRGIMDAISQANIKDGNKELLKGFKEKIARQYDSLSTNDETGERDWIKLLRKINR